MLGTATFDFLSSTGPRPPRFNPYVVAGGGYMRHHSKLPSTFVHHEGVFTAGGDVRIQVSDRVAVAPEASIGWEPHLRFGATVSIRLGPD